MVGSESEGVLRRWCRVFVQGAWRGERVSKEAHVRGSWARSEHSRKGHERRETEVADGQKAEWGAAAAVKGLGCTGAAGARQAQAKGGA
jgi:hypothetical protein